MYGGDKHTYREEGINTRIAEMLSFRRKFEGKGETWRDIYSYLETHGWKPNYTLVIKINCAKNILKSIEKNMK